jgi:hypothetical protein
MKRWTLIRDRALVLESQGIKYDEAFQMAMREIPSDGSESSRATVANTRPRFSNVNQRTPQELALARNAIQEGVAKIIRDKGLDRLAAWNSFATDNPDLRDLMDGRMGAAADAGDSAGYPPGQGVPLCSPQCSALFGMAYSPDQDEFAAAWNSNRATANPVDTPAIFKGLTDYWAVKNNTSPDAAAAFVRGRHPHLAERMDAIASHGARPSTI